MPETIGALVWWGSALILAVAGWLFVKVYDNLHERIENIERRVTSIENEIENKLDRILHKMGI